MPSTTPSIKPLNDKVLVERIEAADKTAGGILLPDTAKEKPTEGIVEAVGGGKVDEHGVRLPMNVKEGDRVLFGRYAGTEVRLGDNEYMVLHETEILAVL